MAESTEDVILIRPPCEAWSVLIGVTEGCNWGKCRFCGVYDGKQLVQRYRVRPWESIKADIDEAWFCHQTLPRRAFLAGGSALSAPVDLLVKTLDYLHKRFPRMDHVSSYAKNHDILKKTDDELKQLADAGLTIVYMGLESGSDAVLKYMNKGTRVAGMIRAARKVMAAGIKLSTYVVLGLGGKMFPDHPYETAKALTSMNPTFIRFRSLNFIPNAPLHDDWMAGKFVALRPVEILQEQLAILEHIGPEVTSRVLNDHVSNFVDIDGQLPGDKERITNILKTLIADPRIQALEHRNRTVM
ncbi:MAG: radical SAM protein [Candidatus Sigynarchaeum springense]